MLPKREKQTHSNFSILIVTENHTVAYEIRKILLDMDYQEKYITIQSVSTVPEYFNVEIDLVILVLNEEVDKQRIFDAISEDSPHKLLVLSIISAQFEKNKQQNFENYLVNYLISPVSKLSIKNAIRSLIESFQYSNKNAIDFYRNGNRIYLKKKGVFLKLLINDILFICTEGEQTFIYTSEDSISCYTSLKVFTEQLEKHHFMRIHKQYLAQLSKANFINIDARMISFNGHTVPFSRRKKSKLLEKLEILSENRKLDQ